MPVKLVSPFSPVSPLPAQTEEMDEMDETDQIDQRDQIDDADIKNKDLTPSSLSLTSDDMKNRLEYLTAWK